MFTQHIEKQRNVHTLNQNDINNSVNSANVPENELTYQFQRWGQNHTVRILESSEGIRLKPSDTIVSDRLHEAQHNDVTAQRWVLTEQDEDKGNDISLMMSKKMKVNSKTIRRTKVNVRSEKSKWKHSFL